MVIGQAGSSPCGRQMSPCGLFLPSTRSWLTKERASSRRTWPQHAIHCMTIDCRDASKGPLLCSMRAVHPGKFISRRMIGLRECSCVGRTPQLISHAGRIYLRPAGGARRSASRRGLQTSTLSLPPSPKLSTCPSRHSPCVQQLCCSLSLHWLHPLWQRRTL